MPGTHSRNSPSDSPRWLRCAGALNLDEESFDEDEGSSDYAKEGSVLHSWAEDCQEFGLEPRHFIGNTRSSEGYSYTMTPLDAEHMQAGLDRLEELEEGESFVEYWVDTTAWVGVDLEGNRQGGTLDRLIVGQTVLTAFDWKWGAGVPVYAKDNEQLRIYTLGVWSQLPAAVQRRIETVRIIIWQPRIPGAGGEWEFPIEELLEFGEHVRTRAEMTRDPDAERTPGEKQCFWCPGSRGSGKCPEYEQWMLEIVGSDFDVLDSTMEFDLPPRLPDARKITPERRSYIVRYKGIFEKWISMLHAETLQDALNGDPTPDLKAVAGKKGARAWVDEEEAQAFLEKHLPDGQLFIKKLISAPQAENLLPTRVWEKVKELELFKQSDGNPILVPLSDERPALNESVDDEFEDISDS